MYNKLTVEDFADIFDTTVDNLPNISKKVIRNSDFRYRIFSGIEREKIFLRVLKTLNSTSLKISGPHKKPAWEKGWSENLHNFVESDFDLNELIPKFVKQKEIIRFRSNYIMPKDSNFETNFVRVMRYYLFNKYFSEVSKVYEFGCGTGLNLIALAELFPEKQLYGLDWSEASCTIVDILSKKFNLNLSSALFDMFLPDEKIEIDETSGVFTIGAMEQLGTNFEDFVRFNPVPQPNS